MNKKQEIVWLSPNEAESMFLKELSNLTIKYNVEIQGCGCCGSPYLETHCFDSEKDINSYKKGKYFYLEKLEFGVQCKDCGKILDFNRDECWKCNSKIGIQF